MVPNDMCRKTNTCFCMHDHTAQPAAITWLAGTLMQQVAGHLGVQYHRVGAACLFTCCVIIATLQLVALPSGGYRTEQAWLQNYSPVHMLAYSFSSSMCALSWMHRHTLDVMQTLACDMQAAFLLFLVAGCMWSSVVIVARKNAHRIHVFMILLVFFKALTLLSQFGMFHLIRTTGHPDGWNIAFYIFTFMRGVLFFTVVILIGTGWSYMKPLLGDNEKRILLVVIPLQVFAEVAIVILDENSPATRNWFTWRDVFHVVDIICCCAILFPIVWSIQHLKEAAETDGKAARNLVKMKLFRQFYVLVVSYIYFTRIVVYLLRSTMSYKYVWLSDAAGELATLLFYVLTGLKFRPHADNPYFAVATEDAEV